MIIAADIGNTNIKNRIVRQRQTGKKLAYFHGRAPHLRRARLNLEAAVFLPRA